MVQGYTETKCSICNREFYSLRQKNKIKFLLLRTARTKKTKHYLLVVRMLAFLCSEQDVHLRVPLVSDKTSTLHMLLPPSRQIRVQSVKVPENLELLKRKPQMLASAGNGVLTRFKHKFPLVSFLYLLETN